MHSQGYFWAAGLIGLSVAYFVVPQKLKEIVSTVLLVAATIFLLLAYGSTFMHHSERLTKSPTVSADQQELMLKIDYAMNKLFASMGQPQALAKKSQFLEFAESGLSKLSREEPDSDVIAAKLVLVAHEAHDLPMVHEGLERIKKSESGTLHPVEILNQPADPKAISDAANLNEQNAEAVDPNAAGKPANKPKVDFYSAFNLLYGNKQAHKQLTAAVVHEYASYFKERLQPGWYQDVALMELYGASGHTKELEKLKNSFDDKCVSTCVRLGLLSLVAGLSFLIGLIVIVVQLFFMPRSESTPENLELVRAPADYGVKNVLGVFVGWLTIQNLLGLLLQGILKPHSLWTQGSLNAAVTVLLLYVVTVSPVILILYLFAFKPYQVPFFEGIKLRTKVANRGVPKLILAGVLTWFAALPMVATTVLITQRFLHSQGSSNPAIGMVMESARAASLPVIAIIFIMIAVLAPFFEESLFRGFLYSYLRRRFNVGVSMLISALIFASVHLDGGGFFPLLVLGLLFALLLEKTKSIIPSIVAHGMWNSGTISILLLLFQS